VTKQEHRVLKVSRKDKKVRGGSTPRLVLTVEEAADLLRIGRGTAYAAVKAKQIPSVKLGRKILVPLGSLEKLLGVAGR
jgi:excisionase family DNA binding protein